MFEQDLAPVCLCGSLQGMWGGALCGVDEGGVWGGREVVEEDETRSRACRGGRHQSRDGLAVPLLGKFRL
jgi:hypothetical protein